MNADSLPSGVQLTSAAKAALDEYLDRMRQAIESEAKQISTGKSRLPNGEIKPADIVEAIKHQTSLSLGKSQHELSDAARLMLQEHFSKVGDAIVREARASAGSEDHPSAEIDPMRLLQAAKTFAPGSRFPSESSFWHRIFSSISGLTLLSLFAAIVFGILGLSNLGGGASNGYLEIAKVFAGVVVGSAGGAAARPTAG